MIAAEPASCLSVLQRAAHWQFEHPSAHDPTDWTVAVFDAGVMAAAQATEDQSLFDVMHEQAKRNRWQLGPRPKHADDQCIGQTYVDLYERYHDPEALAEMRRRCDQAMAHPDERDLSYEHPDRFDRWTWCDALFMAPPTLARLARVTGDERYLNYAIRGWWRTSDYLYDPAEHLFARDSRYLGQREPNGAKVFWSRGNGWVMAGLVRMLQAMPASHPDRARFVRQFTEMAERVVGLQGPDGFWRASLLDPAEYPLAEASGTGLFCYALAWGVNNGILSDPRYAAAARKAWAALAGCVGPEGRLSHVQPIGQDPRQFDADATEVYGVGALLLAASEIYLLRAEPAAATSPDGSFRADWSSLAAYGSAPEWFRDAKFGIWAHWGPQCEPEDGDWYARNMYIQGTPQYADHLLRYGHPSKFGFKDIDNAWHAEHWDPERLMRLYVAAGAHYFVALANHHDNFDCYDSKYHGWNSVRVGPHQDIVGTWARIARAHGLRFGVSNHSAHAWHWLQVAYGHDADGPYANVPYDGWLTRADGKGQWWEGLDPQELYCGPQIVLPDTVHSAAEVQAWHKEHTRPWNEQPPESNPDFVRSWVLRTRDLIDSYHPDLLYFDDFGLPLGQAGLDIAAHFYNANREWHNGREEGVINAKKIPPSRQRALVEDYERGFSDIIQPLPWQTDTCIGDWHYKRGITYKSVGTVVQMLIDIVSKNGNLLLNIPVRGDGTIDDAEIRFLEELARWMRVNGEGIFATRPWVVAGEGPTRPVGGMFNEGRTRFTAHDVRYTRKDSVLYAFLLGWPDDGRIALSSLGSGDGGQLTERVAAISLLGSDRAVHWTRTDQALQLELGEKPADVPAYTLKIQLEPSQR